MSPTNGANASRNSLASTAPRASHPCAPFDCVRLRSKSFQRAEAQSSGIAGLASSRPRSHDRRARPVALDRLRRANQLPPLLDRDLERRPALEQPLIQFEAGRGRIVEHALQRAAGNPDPRGGSSASWQKRAYPSRVALRSESRTGVGVTTLSRLIAYPPCASSGRVSEGSEAGGHRPHRTGRRLGKRPLFGIVAVESQLELRRRSRLPSSFRTSSRSGSNLSTRDCWN